MESLWKIGKEIDTVHAKSSDLSAHETVALIQELLQPISDLFDPVDNYMASHVEYGVHVESPFVLKMASRFAKAVTLHLSTETVITSEAFQAIANEVDRLMSLATDLSTPEAQKAIWEILDPLESLFDPVYGHLSVDIDIESPSPRLCSEIAFFLDGVRYYLARCMSGAPHTWGTGVSLWDVYCGHARWGDSWIM